MTKEDSNSKDYIMEVFYLYKHKKAKYYLIFLVIMVVIFSMNIVTAAHIFIDRLSPEDYLGIITFNSKEEVILPIQTESTVEGTSRTAYIYWGLIGLLIVAPLLMVLLGWLFYKIYVYKHTIVTGKLLYRKEGEEFSSQNTFDFEPLKKVKIIITFDENKSQAQYHLPNTEYKYDIELYVDREKSKWKFLDGWKAVLRKETPSEIILKTMKPGIFIYEDKVYSKKKLYGYDKFTSGGYEFDYQVEGKDKKKGKNVLEGIS